MGLDIEPIIPEGQEKDAFWPQQQLHYNWSRFSSLLRVVAHNAVLTGVAKDTDDPTVALILKVKECDQWTAEQCRDVHILIRKTINASKCEPDPQAVIAKKKHQEELAAFRTSVMSMMTTTLKPEAEEEEEDSMVVEEEEDSSRAWLKMPSNVSFYYCPDPDQSAIEFGETMAVFYTNGWGAGFY